MKRTVCFDASAISNLAIDPDADRLTSVLEDRYVTYITALNVAEIGKTSSPPKREQLRALEKRLAGETRPLDVPNEIVKKLSGAFGRGETTVTFSVTGERESLWIAMSEPNSINDEECADLKTWTRDLEQSNEESNRRFRARVDEIFAADPAARPTTAGGVLRFYMRSPWPLLYALPSQGGSSSVEYSPANSG